MVALVWTIKVTGNEMVGAIASISVLIPYYLVLFLCRNRIKKDFGFRIIV